MPRIKSVPVKSPSKADVKPAIVSKKIKLPLKQKVVVDLVDKELKKLTSNATKTIDKYAGNAAHRSALLDHIMKYSRKLSNQDKKELAGK